MIYMLCASPGARIPKYVATIDAQGRSVFEKGCPSHPPSEVYADISRGVEVMDRMLTSGVEMILSETASVLLAKLNHCESIVNVQCTLKTDSSVASAVQPYRLWYATKEHDILDRESSLVKTANGHLLSVMDWAISKKQLPNCDLFLGPTNKWFASERFVDEVYRNRLSGFGFMTIPCY